MKKIVIFILFQFIVVCSFAQPKGSNDYTNSINEYTISIFNLIHNRFKDTLNLRRLETGILTTGDDNQLTGATSRRLFGGNKYLIFVCTDDRVSGFSLSSYHNVDHKWNLIETVNKDKKEPDAALIGNYEIYDLDVTEDGLYKFAITTPNKNKTARYAFMIFSKKTSGQTTTTTPVTSNKGGSPLDPVQGGLDPVPNSGTAQQYSIDYYNVCFWNATTSKYGDWGPDKPYVCSFALSGDKTVFSQTIASGTVYKFTVQSTRSDASWNIYEVLDADGKKMTFLLPTDTKRAIFRVRGENKNGETYLIDYHVKS